MMIRVLLILLALGALLGGVGTYRYLHAPTASLPEPVLVDLEGKSHSLKDWRGKVLVVNFWATWCAPCREEIPMFVGVQDELGARGVQFVGVAIDDPAAVRTYLEKLSVNYPMLIGGSDVPAWADSLGNEISALPFTVIFDAQGKKVFAHVGALKKEPLLETLKAALSP